MKFSIFPLSHILILVFLAIGLCDSSDSMEVTSERLLVPLSISEQID